MAEVAVSVLDIDEEDAVDYFITLKLQKLIIFI